MEDPAERRSFIGGEISDDEAIVDWSGKCRVDGIGGESIRLIDDMVRLVEAGTIRSQYR